MHEASINLSSASKYELTFLKKNIELLKYNFDLIRTFDGPKFDIWRALNQEVEILLFILNNDEIILQK